MLVLFAGFVKSNYAQSTVNADVIAVVQQGAYSYALINETGTSNVYQTSAFYSTQGYLTTNQQIQLSFEDLNDKAQGEVDATTINNVICFLNAQSTSSSINVTYPTLSNDILFFDDRDHLNDFHDWMEELKNLSTVEEFDLLDSIEAGIVGYESYRTVFETEHNLHSGTFSNQELMTIIESDFIKDEILKTMLNHDRMIGIGDSVFFWRAENVILGFDADNQNLISTIAAAHDSIDLFGIDGLIALAGDPHLINIFSPYYDIPGLGNYAFLEVDENLSYETFPVLENFDCETYNKAIKVDIVETYDDGTFEDVSFYHLGEDGTLTIDWGDEIVQIIENYHGEWIEHTYAALDTYYPKTKLEFLDRYGDPQEMIDGEEEEIKFIVEIACTSADASTVDYTVSGSYRMVSQVFVHDNWITRQIAARTTFFEYSGGGWKEEKADVYAKVNGVFRDYNCVVKETKSETKLRHSQRSVQSDKTKFWRYYDVANGDIISRHYCVKGGLFLEVNLVLNPC